MTTTDANPPLPEFRDDYVLQQVDAAWLTAQVKPKQFIHIDQSECIMCEGCVDICPWKCIHMVRPDAVDEAIGTELPGDDPNDNVIFRVDFDQSLVTTHPMKHSSKKGTSKLWHPKDCQQRLVLSRMTRNR